MKRPALIVALLLLSALACRVPGLVVLGPTTQEATRVAEAVEQTLQAVQPPATETAPIETGLAPATDLPDLPTPVSTLGPGDPGGPPRPVSYEVAYVLHGDIYLWQPGLADERLTNHGQAVGIRISPDRTWIAYTKSSDQRRQELWAIRADGSTHIQLAGPEDFTSPDPQFTPVPDQFEWVPASHRLVYSTMLVSDGPGMPMGNDLRQIDLDTREKRALVEPGQGGRFSFSPDGQKILFTHGAGFNLSNIDGSDLREIFSFPSISTYSEWAYLPDPVWAADSASFRVIIPPPTPMERPDDPTLIYQVNVINSSSRVLGSFHSVPAYRVRPLLSPNGEKLLYQTAPTPESANTDLHVASVDLSADQVLTSGNLAVRGWSPDSHRFVIWTFEQREMRVGTLTGEMQGFPVGIKPFELEWVDPARFMLLSGSYDAPELYRGTVDGQFARLAVSTVAGLAYDY